MYMISERIKNLAPSATLMMSQMAGEMKAKGIDVINLSVGEPDFATPEHICAAGKKAIEDGYTRYTPVDGYLSLREAICEKLSRENGLSYSADEIVVSGGGKQGVCNVVMSLINSGDEVIIPAPYWVSYPQMVELAEGKSVIVDTSIENNYCMTAEELESAITSKTKLLILCSPSNPTGSVYKKEELDRIADVLRRHEQVYILSDEIYEHIIFGDAKHYSLAQYADLRERVIVANGVSKAYAMTGWRIGWIAASKEIVKACKKLQGQQTSCSSSISQKAAEAAYRGSQECVENMRCAFEKRRDLVVKLAEEIEGIKLNKPQGAFYLLMDISAYFGKSYDKYTISSAKDLCLYLLEEAWVTLVDGAAFGSPKTLRLSYAASEEQLIEAFKRIKKALMVLK
ncbi:MAG: pyridoxal phosphate-dependent aminotransferase [Paludibacteraceae bacterium]|nr:pyridoxal phosphate-dependent aminotransferase [Paludibacteraceae bacterium]